MKFGLSFHTSFLTSPRLEFNREDVDNVEDIPFNLLDKQFRIVLELDQV